MRIPEGSLYFWMYEQGLRHTDLHEVELSVSHAGKNLRQKDIENYWNGYFRSDLYGKGAGSEDIFMLRKDMLHRRPAPSQEFMTTRYEDYPQHPYANCGYPEIENRWVPCSKDNKPMIKWGQGCMSIADAVAYKDQMYLAENLKGTRFIVIDCDGNHDDPWDLETISFLHGFTYGTHTISKPGYMSPVSPSFHLTFRTDRIIPTMHFPYAHIDIVGNRRNSLRYWKNKVWNGIEPAWMDEATWGKLQDYIKYRKEKADA